jgi:DNA-binding NarL/FixJ family response regulator
MEMMETQQEKVAIRLVLADNHRIFLEGLAQLMALESDFEVVARCVNGAMALQAVRGLKPDILLLDLNMSGKDGLTVLSELHKEKSNIKAIILAAEVTEDEVMEALRLGVRGVVLKEMAPQQLMQCIRKVHAGGEWLERRSVGRALEKILRRAVVVQEIRQVLTTRELQMVKMIAHGLSNKETARRLSIAEGTVKIHLHNIYQKLDIKGRMELMLYAQREGLI